MMPFPREARDGSFQLLASGAADDGALTINADALILGATLAAGTSLTYAADPQRHLYLVASGRVLVNGFAAEPRDGIAITGEDQIVIKAEADAELVLVDAR